MPEVDNFALANYKCLDVVVEIELSFDIVEFEIILLSLIPSDILLLLLYES